MNVSGTATVTADARSVQQSVEQKKIHLHQLKTRIRLVLYFQATLIYNIQISYIHFYTRSRPNPFPAFHTVLSHIQLTKSLWVILTQILYYLTTAGILAASHFFRKQLVYCRLAFPLYTPPGTHSTTSSLSTAHLAAADIHFFLCPNFSALFFFFCQQQDHLPCL